MELGKLVPHQARPANLHKTAMLNADPAMRDRLSLLKAGREREEARRQARSAVPRPSAALW